MTAIVYLTGRLFLCLFIALRTNGITKSKASNAQDKTLASKANRLSFFPLTSPLTPPILYVRITLSKKGVVACEACSGFRQDVRKDRKPDDYFVKRDFLCIFLMHKRSFSFVQKIIYVLE